jgi:hypothetical protein
MFGAVIFIIITFSLFTGLENNNVKAEINMQISESNLTLNNADLYCASCYELSFFGWIQYCLDRIL